MEEKLELLMDSEYKGELIEMINNLYNEKYPQREQTKRYGFNVGGTLFTKPTTNENYLNVIRHFEGVVGYGVFSKVLKNYVRDSYDSFPDSYKGANQVVKMRNFYLTTKTTTDMKISHIKSLCEYLDVPVMVVHMSL
jgi:hypothetical protein